MKNLAILGCTGSIGRTTLKIVENHPEEFRIVLLANNENIEELLFLGKKFNVPTLFCQKGLLIRNGKEESFDKDFLCKAEAYDSADIVINAISGISGLLPSFAALKAEKILATANKESVVCGGELLRKECDFSKVYPLDSEHSTVWQCIDRPENVQKIILTASGGAFRDLSDDELKNAKAVDALKHPNWMMGKKITIDCATLVNKGLEIIEAKRFFQTDEVEAVLHRESIIHSFVEMKDGALIAGLSNPDMTIPIQYALSYPRRIASGVKKLSLTDIKTLNFDKIDEKRFPCFSLCKEAARYGDYAGTILTATDEIASRAYLNDEIGFYDIADLLEKSFLHFGLNGVINSTEELLRIYEEAEEYTKKSIKELGCC